MFITPFMAALILGSTFWTGVAATSVAGHDGWNGWGAAAPAADVTIGVNTDHQNACHARYHSYGSNTAYPDEWLGRDGQWHVCTL